MKSIASKCGGGREGEREREAVENLSDAHD